MMAGNDTPTELSCLVEDIQPLNADIHRAWLKPLSGFFPAYLAGQYLQVILETGQRCAFSIASAPADKQENLELHIQKVKGNDNSAQLFKELTEGRVRISMPKGNCFLPTPLPDKPLLFIAAGTGFAQIKSMVDHCLAKHHAQKLHLYWGARTPTDFYLPHLPIQWATRGLIYHPVVSNASTEDDWCGRHGLLYEAVLADRQKIHNAEIYLSGSPAMVYTTIDVMVEAGFSEKHLHSDVFDYSPRKP
ncbi:MAG: NAD(P)H-flavin reductase [Endozoicomonas sp.]